MTLDELIPLAAQRFAVLKLAYFVIGGVAVSIYGRPRTTHDLDVIVRLKASTLSDLAKDLRRFGFKIARLEERKIREGKMVRLPIGKTELDVRRSAQGHDEEAFRRAKTAAFPGFQLRVASPEDLILYKLQSWRTQDQADIENVVSRVKDLDRRYLSLQFAAVQRESGAPVEERWKEIQRRLG